jgi:hypothetical protein
VDRIFVAAAVKIEMCKTATRADKKWLQKIRPVAGHDTHFHVRLKCPKGARLCETQTPTVAELSKGGDGCDETLMWWVTDYLDPPKSDGKKPRDEDAPRKKGPREFTMADLPRSAKPCSPPIDRGRAAGIGRPPPRRTGAKSPRPCQNGKVECASFFLASSPWRRSSSPRTSSSSIRLGPS